MAETQLWEWLKPFCPQGKYDRIESPDTAPGTPDVYYRLTTNSGWIELKDARHPKAKIPFPNEKVGLHLSQKIWIREEVRLGGLVWIVARIGKDILWIPGKDYYHFNHATKLELLEISTLSFNMTERRIPVERIWQKLTKGVSK